MAYRFRQIEIDVMKHRIMTIYGYETDTDVNGNKSAWRLRRVLECLAYECASSKRERASHIRQLALYNSLTRDDMPAFAPSGAI